MEKRNKVVYISEEAHQLAKEKSPKVKKTVGEYVEDLIINDNKKTK